MKKRIIVLFMVFFISGFLFAGTSWTKAYHTDEFGDKTSNFSVYTGMLSGSYETRYKSNGKLSYQIEIDDRGRFYIYLYEDADTKKDLSVPSPYTVQIKLSDGRTRSCTGESTINPNSYVENIIYIPVRYDFRHVFINENSLKIVITSKYGTYNLGVIDTSGIDSQYFFDKSLYNEGLSLMAEGKYEEAIAKFNEMRSTDREAFEYYEVSKSIKECESKIAKQIYDTGLSLMGEGKYEEAITKFNEMKDKDSEAFEYYKASKSIEECESKISKQLYDTGLSLMAEGKYEEAITKFNEMKNKYREAFKSYNVKESYNECYLKLGSCCGYEYVFYDKGYYSDGWRFLEAAPEDLRLLKNGKPTVDSSVKGFSDAQKTFIFGYYKRSANGACLYVNGTSEYNSSDCTATEIGAGKKNTELLVGAMGSSAYVESGDKTSKYAAKLCFDLVYNGFDDWLLPSKDELNLMCENMYKAGIGGFTTYGYWSSSECYTSVLRMSVQEYSVAWEQSFAYGGGDQYKKYRDSYYRVRPVRAF